MTRYITALWEDVYTSEKLTLKELAMVEPLAVGFHAVERGRISEQDTVLENGGFPVDEAVSKIVPLADAGKALTSWADVIVQSPPVVERVSSHVLE